MRATRIRDLLAIAVVAAVIVWGLADIWYGSIPRIPFFAGASLYPIAVIEAVLAFVVRSRVAKRELGSDRRQLHPITVARALALAKASALVGALSVGVWAGYLAFLVPRSSFLRAAAGDITGTVVGLCGGLALAVAALWLEHCCRSPDEPPEDRAGESDR